MTALQLKVKTRTEVGKKVRNLRTSGKIPAVLYGHGVANAALTVDEAAFQKVFGQAGESTLIDLALDDGSAVKVLIQQVQLDPLSNQITHIDFHQVRMDEKIHAQIELKFVGEAPAIKELSAVLVTSLHSLEVECLPGDLVHEIDVDLSGLKTFEDAIHISDITAPKGIKILNHPEDMVVAVQEPRSEKELEVAAPAPVEGAPVEGAAPAAPEASGDQGNKKE